MKMKEIELEKDVSAEPATTDKEKDVELHLSKIDERIDTLEESLKDIELDEDRIITIEARIQSSIDLTDDIVGTANNLIATTEARIDKTLTNADMVLDHADFLSSTFLVILGLMITVASVIVTWILGRRQEQHIKDAVSKVTERLNKDEEFSSEFIRSLISHEDLRTNVNYSISQIAREMIDEANGIEDDKEFSNIRNSLDLKNSEDEVKLTNVEEHKFFNKIRDFFKR